MQQWPDLHLVHVADGAQDNWTFFDEDMPLGFQVTDFYHAFQYPKDLKKLHSKFKKYQAILRDEPNGINSVLRAVRYLRDEVAIQTVAADSHLHVTYCSVNSSLGYFLFIFHQTFRTPKLNFLN